MPEEATPTTARAMLGTKIQMLLPVNTFPYVPVNDDAVPQHRRHPCLHESSTAAFHSPADPVVPLAVGIPRAVARACAEGPFSMGADVCFSHCADGQRTVEWMIASTCTLQHVPDSLVGAPSAWGWQAHSQPPPPPSAKLERMRCTSQPQNLLSMNSSRRGNSSLLFEPRPRCGLWVRLRTSQCTARQLLGQHCLMEQLADEEWRGGCGSGAQPSCSLPQFLPYPESTFKSHAPNTRTCSAKTSALFLKRLLLGPPYACGKHCTGYGTTLYWIRDGRFICEESSRKQIKPLPQVLHKCDVVSHRQVNAVRSMQVTFRLCRFLGKGPGGLLHSGMHPFQSYIGKFISPPTLYWLLYAVLSTNPNQHHILRKPPSNFWSVPQHSV